MSRSLVLGYLIGCVAYWSWQWWSDGEIGFNAIFSTTLLVIAIAIWGVEP